MERVGRESSMAISFQPHDQGQQDGSPLSRPGEPQITVGQAVLIKSRRRSTAYTVEELLRLRARIDQELQQRLQQRLCLMFADVAGSTSFYQRHGDVQGRLLVQRHYDTLSPLITAMGGRVVKTIGDAIMATFEEPRQAIACAMEAQCQLWDANQRGTEHAELRTKISLHYGPALVEEQDIYGDVVNVAARLNKMAKPGQILITQHVYDQLKEDAVFMVLPLSCATWKEEQPVPMYEVMWRQKAETARWSKLFRDFRGSYNHCFYCGLQEHQARGCPSRLLEGGRQPTSRLGYLPLHDLLSLLQHEPLAVPAPGNISPRTIFDSFYQMSLPYQLRLLATMWLTNSTDWHEVESTPLEPSPTVRVSHLWCGFDAFRSGQPEQAKAFWEAARKDTPDDYRPYVGLGFQAMEQENPVVTLQYWHQALSLALTPLQKVYIHLLLHRLYAISDKPGLAQDELHHALAIQPHCPEARYRQAVLLMQQEAQEAQGLQQLQQLIAEDRHFYLQALVELTVTGRQRIVYYFLSFLVQAAHAGALALVLDVSDTINDLRQWYTQPDNDIRVIDHALERLQRHLQSQSYYGYRDIVYEGRAVRQHVAALRKQRQAQAQDMFQETLRTVHAQLDTLETMVRRHDDTSSQLSALRKQLARLYARVNLTVAQQFWQTWQELQQLQGAIRRLTEQHQQRRTWSRRGRDVMRVLGLL